MTRRLLTVAVATVAFGAVAAPAFADPVVTTAPCPPGDKGVVVGTLGRQLVVCTNV